MGGNVAGTAEKRGVTKGQQPDIADQEVEGAGKESEAERLHQKDGVEDKGSGERRDKEDRRQKPLRPAAMRHLSA
jgi:hypothetical protein